MTTQRDPASAMGSQGKAEDARARAQAAAQELQKSNDALEDARRQFQEAQQKLDASDTALRNAIDAQVAAKGQLSDAQLKAKLASKDSDRDLQAKAKVEAELERANNRLKDQEGKAAKAEAKGKKPDQLAMDKAQNEVEGAREKAQAAILQYERAKQDLETSQQQLETAEMILQTADNEVSQAKEALATAKIELSQAEDNVKKRTKEASDALKNHNKADSDAEKALKKYEADLAKAEAKAAALRPIQQYTDPPVPAPQSVEDENPSVVYSEPEEPETQELRQEPASSLKEAEQIAATAIEREDTISNSQAAAPGGDLFGGIVTLFIARPVKYTQIKQFKDSLGQLESLRVRSIVGSSGDGSQITLSVEEPTPLMVRLNALDNVAMVSKTGKGIEVTLKS